jgi:hypothetical protein
MLKTSPKAMAVSALPSLLMLGLFYSLALHMRQSLGRWPAAIGESGFPPLLVIHANLTVLTFELLFLSSLYLVPPAMLVCLFEQRWQRFIPRLALYAALFFISWGCMQLAPGPFLDWWSD